MVLVFSEESAVRAYPFLIVDTYNFNLTLVQLAELFTLALILRDFLLLLSADL